MYYEVSHFLPKMTITKVSRFESQLFLMVFSEHAALVNHPDEIVFLLENQKSYNLEFQENKMCLQ